VCRLVAFALEDAMFKQCKARRDALVFDYVWLGIYLISICTSNKQCVLDVSSSSVFVLCIDELGILLFASEQVSRANGFCFAVTAKTIKNQHLLA